MPKKELSDSYLRYWQIHIFVNVYYYFLFNDIYQNIFLKIMLLNY